MRLGRRAARWCCCSPRLPARPSAALPIPPPPDHRINDYAGVLSADERARLEDTLRARERESSNQIVVAIFRSLQGESLEDYSIRLAQAWRVGQKGLDNGVIFLVFVDDRKMRLEVGYGLEAKLTDALSSQILRQVVAPRFREGKIADGIAAGLDAIEQAIAGTYKAAPQGQPARAQGWNPFQLMLLLIVVGGIFSIVIPALYGSHVRRQGWTGGSARLGRPHHLHRRRLGRRRRRWRWRRGRRLRGRRRRLRRRRGERRLVMARHPKWVRAFLSEDDLEAVARAVAEAERHTSAEVRVHLDHSCDGRRAPAGHQGLREARHAQDRRSATASWSTSR